jgi:hypothetical protein
VARADVLIEARSVEGQTLADGLVTVRCGPLQSRLDLMALRRIGSVRWAANACKLGRAKPRLCAVTTNHVGECADSAASLVLQFAEFLGRAFDQLPGVQERREPR